MILPFHFWQLLSLNKFSLFWPLHDCCNEWLRYYESSVVRFRYYPKLNLKRKKKSVYIMNKNFSRKKFQRKTFCGKSLGQIKSLEKNCWQNGWPNFWSQDLAQDIPSGFYRFSNAFEQTKESSAKHICKIYKNLQSVKRKWIAK